MPEHEYKVLLHSQIFLDPENPRHDLLDSQRELIHAMIEDQGDRLVELAKDIIAYGINPSDVPIVIPDNSDSESYIVTEGNRRIAVLKLLHNPSLCSGTKLERQFSDLSKTFLENPVNELGCIVYPQRADTRHWVKLKHTGENKGAGTVRWDSTAQQRFDAAGSKPTPELQIINFLSNLEGLSPDIQRKFRQMSITTTRRLVGDPNVRAFLGLDLNGGQLRSRLSTEDAVEVLLNFFLPFATRDKKVTDVYHKVDRKEYLDAIAPALSGKERPRLKQAWALASPPKGDKKKTVAATPPPAPGSKPNTKSKPLSINRRFLIDKPISISHNRINGIYNELRKLEVREFPNAAAVLLRVFLEMSVDNFIEDNNIESHANDKLAKKVSKVGTYMENNGLLSNEKLKPVRKAVSDQHSLFSTNTFNAYVHNSTIQPKPTELNATWDEMSDFIRQLWA